MAYSTCEKHGGNVSDMTSPLIRANMDNGIIHAKDDIQRLFFSDERVSSLLLNKTFLEECGLFNVTQINFEIDNANHLKLYESIVPVCSYCFKEYLEKIGIER
jgi:hypothetical protein